MCFYTRSPKKRNAIKQYEAVLLQSLKPTTNNADTATFRRATKVLLLGPSGCGKSTIIRKLRMQSGIRISDDEREQARDEILAQMYDALVASIAELKVCGALAASVSDVGIRALLRLTQPDISHGTWTRERLAAMRTLYEDPLVLDTALRRRDTAGFIKRLLLSTDNVLQPEWRPTDADVMQCHVPDQKLTGMWVSKDVVAFEQSISVKDELELCGATIQLMDSVVFILDLSSSGVLGKDRLDTAFDSLAHVINHRSMQKKPIQILLNKTDTFLCNINEVLLPDVKHRTSIDGVARYLAEYMGGLERLHVRHINALSAGWMKRLLEEWRLMGVYKNLVEFGLIL